MTRIKRVKEYLEEQKTLQESIKKWKKTGMFDGLTSEESIMLAGVLNQVLKLFENEPNSVVFSLIITIIVRTFRTYKYLVKDIRAVAMHINNRISLLHELISKAYNGIDGEVEFCVIMAEEIFKLKL